ncbi:MAG TPA: hypothetical protein VMZ91_02360 [Candidatus Paceibacterota bacterium]|nr:hypothetical protein [Candidatus Paceibacterota bacterium]
MDDKIIFIDIMYASVSEDQNGIDIIASDMEGKPYMLSMEANANYGDINLTIKEDQNKVKELLLLCQVLNGFKEENGTFIKNENHIPKRIKLIQKNR